MLVPYALMRWRGWNGLRRSRPRQRAALERRRARLPRARSRCGSRRWWSPRSTSGDPEHRAYLQRTAVQADRDALRERLAPHAAGLVFPRSDRGVLAAVLARAAVAVPALARCVPRARCARVAAAGVGVAGAGVLQRQPGKRDMYILPMLPMVALAAGPYLRRSCGKPWFRRVPARAGRRAGRRVPRRGRGGAARAIRRSK